MSIKHIRSFESFMSIEAHFLYQDKIFVHHFDKDILNCTTIRAFFDIQLLPFFNFEQSYDNYLLFTNKPHEIDDEKLSILRLSHDGKNQNVAILNKYEFTEVQHYCDTVLPSLLSVSAQTSQTGIALASNINFIRGLYMNAINDENASFMLSMIPEEILSKPQLDRVQALLQWFQELPFTQEDGSIHCYHCETPTKMVLLPDRHRVSLEEHQKGAIYTIFFKCDKCGTILRVPRYASAPFIKSNHVHFEEDSVFLFLSALKAVSIDSRIVFIPPSMFCIEFWSDEKQRYVHVDPYQNIIDFPLVYQSEYQMRVLYAIAVGEFECLDVTSRYSVNPLFLVDIKTYMDVIKIKSTMYKTHIEPGKEKELAKRNELDTASMKTITREKPEGLKEKRRHSFLFDKKH